MPEKVVPGPVCEDRSIREAVCIHTKKIFDSCRDKDCVEDLRVYPTRCSQEVIDRAQSIKAGSAELLYAYIDVEPVTFNRGFYTVDVRYFYRITADAFVGASRPVQVCGLAVFSKRAVLFGSESGSKSFTSVDNENQVQCVPQSSLPTAVVEAVDPLILSLKLVDVCECRPCDCGCVISPCRWPPASATSWSPAATSTGCSSPWASSPSSVWSGIPSCSSPPMTTAFPPRIAAAARTTARRTPATCSVRSSSR